MVGFGVKERCLVMSECWEEMKKDLYEKTRKATEDSQKQAVAQLNAVLQNKKNEANDPSLFEFDHCRVQIAKMFLSNKIDFVPAAFELVFYTSLVLSKKLIADTVTTPKQFLGSICAAFFCVAILTSQLAFPQWYQGCRKAILQYLAAILWTWESVQLFLMTENDWIYITYHSLALSTCMGVLHQIPYSIHIRLQVVGMLFQSTAVVARGKWGSDLILLLIIACGHVFGLLVVYLLAVMTDSVSRNSSTSHKVEKITIPPVNNKFTESYGSSIFEYYESILSSQNVEKALNLVATSSVKLEQGTRHRALGGFAGGFAGVSGLRCKLPSSVSLFSSVDSFSETEEALDFDSDEDISSSSVWTGGRLLDFDSDEDISSSSVWTGGRLRRMNEEQEHWKGGLCANIESSQIHERLKHVRQPLELGREGLHIDTASSQTQGLSC